MVVGSLHQTIFGAKKVICRAPHFSRWLCLQKRRYDFQWASLAHHLGVSPQCIDSYANGRAHPQIMKFVKIIEFMDEHRSDDYKTILLDAINAIKQDQKEHEKKIQHQITTK